MQAGRRSVEVWNFFRIFGFLLDLSLLYRSGACNEGAACPGFREPRADESLQTSGGCLDLALFSLSPRLSHRPLSALDGPPPLCSLAMPSSTSNSLIAAGSNGQGQLGIGTLEDVSQFTASVSPSISSLATGANHTLLVTTDGQLYVSGRDRCHDLYKLAEGDETRFKKADLSILPVEVIEAIRGYELDGVACAWETSFLHFRYGGRRSRLVSFGANDFGERGCDEARSWATLVDLGEVDVLEFVTGPRHVVVRIRNEEGGEKVLGWGGARQGQLGPLLDARGALESPMFVYMRTHWCTGKPLRFVASPNFIRLPFDDPSSASIQQIAAGKDYTAFLLADGRLCVLSNAGGNEGIALVDLAASRPILLRSTWRHIMVLCDERRTIKRLDSSGATEAEDAMEEQIGQLVCGSEHAVTISRSGRAHVWGWNEHGNLGLGHGDNVERWTEVSLADNARALHAFAGNATTWLCISRAVS